MLIVICVCYDVESRVIISLINLKILSLIVFVLVETHKWFRDSQVYCVDVFLSVVSSVVFLHLQSESVTSVVLT